MMAMEDVSTPLTTSFPSKFLLVKIFFFIIIVPNPEWILLQGLFLQLTFRGKKIRTEALCRMGNWT